MPEIDFEEGVSRGHFKRSKDIASPFHCKDCDNDLYLVEHERRKVITVKCNQCQKSLLKVAK